MNTPLKLLGIPGSLRRSSYTGLCRDGLYAIAELTAAKFVTFSTPTETGATR